MQKTKMICNKFSGINRVNSVYTSSLVTAVDMQNVELFTSGTNNGVGIRTMKGNTAVCSLIPEGEYVINMFESIQKGITYFFVHTENSTEGKIYLFNPHENTLTQMVAELSMTGKSMATDVAQGWSDLWVFSNSEEILTIEIGKTNENDEPEEVEFLTLTDSDERSVKGLGVTIFAGRLWIYSGQTLWYSVQENIYDFSTSSAELSTSAGYIEFVKPITAIYPYLGTLAVFHRNSSCLISRDDDGMFYKTLEFPGGCAGEYALVFHGTELYFYDDSKKGIFSYIQVINGDKTLGDNIAVDIQDEIFSIPANKVSDIRTLSVVTSDKNEVWFLLPSNNENYSTIMIYDYMRKCWVKRCSQKINCIAIVNDKLYSGGSKIYEEYSSNSFDGEFIKSYYNCAPMNLGSNNSIKIIFAARITVDPNYTNKFYVQYTKNFDGNTTKTRYITTKSLKNVLYYDIGHWDNTYFSLKEVNSFKTIPSAYFKTLQINFLTKESGEDFCIKNIEFGKIKIKQ